MICRRCGKEKDGKLFADSITEYGFYCHGCILAFSIRRLKSRLNSGRELYSDLPHIDKLIKGGRNGK